MTRESRELVLEPLHESLGACWAVDRGVRVPRHYGDSEGERQALTEGLALWDASGNDRFELLGNDRHRFLNGMVTADVAALEPGHACYGLFTNVKGRILADATILAHPDRLWVRLPALTGGDIRQHLERFIITDQVEIVPLDDMVPIVVAGPAAIEALTRHLDGGELPQPGEHRRAVFLGTEVCLLHEDRVGGVAFSLWISGSVVRDLVPALLEGPQAPRPVGLEAVEDLRIASGLPRFGSEMGPDTFPQEAGVDDGVSYEKGCYLGQEVVARIHYRGGVQRFVVRLTMAAGSRPDVGEAVSFEGREVGSLTSVAPRAEGAGWSGLAMLAKRATETETVVTLAGGQEATVEGPAGGSS